MSAGEQKNFLAFANQVAEQWEVSPDAFNESYWKQLVAQAILYNKIRGEVARQPWYQSGYLANIVTYTIAKISDVVATKGHGEFDLNGIWQRQALSAVTERFAIQIAEKVLSVLVSDARPVANVTEWAKREQCWRTVQDIPVDLPADLATELVSTESARAVKRDARVVQRVDNGIQLQAAALAISRDEWLAVRRFATEHRMLTPTEAGCLDLVTRVNPSIPSERQAGRLMELRDRVSTQGYDYQMR